MKKILALCAFLFICVSAAFAIHPLIGKWKFSEIIGGVRFYNYITITTVDTITKRVVGHVTGYPEVKFRGYYNGNIVFIGDVGSDSYFEGFYFTFQGTASLKKHLSVYSYFLNLDTKWHALTVTKLSSSTVSNEITTLDEILNQRMLKKQAHLREIIVTQGL